MSKTRTPAPLRLVTVPAGLMLRPVRRKRAATKRATDLDLAIARRLPPPAEAIADKTETVSARDWLYRNRRAVLAPLLAAVLLAAARLVVGWMPAGWTPGRFAVVVPALGLAFAGARWVQQIKDTQNARAAQATLAAALAWLVWPASWQIPTGAPAHVTRWALLLIGTLIVCGVRHQRFAPREEEPVQVEAGPVEIWTAHLASEGQKFAGSALVDYQRLGDRTWTARVAGVPGKHGTEEIRDGRKVIAGIYRINPDWIEIQGTDDYALPRIIVTEVATLSGYVAFMPGGVDVAAGTVEMATHPDGSRASIQAYKPGQGVKHLWFVGGTGGGKTGALSCYLGRMMATGLMVLDLADLGETSLPAWVGPAFRSGTTVAEGLMTLRRANAVMDARKAWMAAAKWVDRDGIQHVGISTLDPSPEWPIYTAAMEEWPEMLTVPEAVYLANRIGRLGRKYNVQIIVVSQPADLKGAFGNADALRMNIQRGGNVVALSNDGGAGTMVFGGTIKVNLGAIPLGQPGLGYVIGPANYRDVMCRMDYIEDKDAIRPPDVMSSFQVAALARPATLNPVDLAAVERVEREEVERLAEAAAESAVEEEVRQAGVNRETVEAALVQAVKASGGPVLLGDVAKILAPAGMDELARRRHDDSVGKFLKKLVEDPTSRACKPTNSAGKAEWGKYGVAS